MEGTLESEVEGPWAIELKSMPTPEAAPAYTWCHQKTWPCKKFADATTLYETMLHRQGVAQESINHITQAILEMGGNILDHVHHFNEKKTIDITLYRHGNGMFIHVTGEPPAQACDLEKITTACREYDPTCEENLLKDRGRGFFILKQFVDGLVMTREGNGFVAYVAIKTCPNDTYGPN
jgi:anti-sigma regulatory factor (Ser/Thr protein kinase)